MVLRLFKPKSRGDEQAVVAEPASPSPVNELRDGLAQFEERRIVTRMANKQQGSLILDDGRIIPIQLTDLSCAGARAKLFADHDLPSNVAFQISGQPEKREARVVWQNDGFVGISF